MSMNQEMQNTFAVFYGMSQSLEGEIKTIEMDGAERVKKVKQTFLSKINRDNALNLDACVHCGWCAEACQFYEVSGDPKYTPIAKLDLMKKVYKRELGPFRWLHKLFTKDITIEQLKEFQPKVFEECTMCRRCSMICPMGIDIGAMVEINREAFTNAGLRPKALTYMVNEQDTEGTIFGATIELLEHKIKEFKDEFGVAISIDKPGADVLMLTSGLDIYLFNDAMLGTIRTLNHLKINWTLSSQDYESANFGFLSGTDDVEKKITMHIINGAVKMGAKMVLVPECGHTYQALRWRAADIYGKPLPFDVMTVSEYFGCQVMEGKLKLKKIPGNKVVTLHDPCEVGRRGGVFEEVRAVIKALGLELQETESNRELNYCCGGGAGNFLITDAAPIRLLGFKKKMEEVNRTEAESLIVSCGSCRLNFEEGKEKINETIDIDSIAALIGDNLLDEEKNPLAPAKGKNIVKPDLEIKLPYKSDPLSEEQFSAQWMDKFKAAWNKNPKLTEPLAEIDFCSNIGYGMIDEEKPRGVLIVTNGIAISAGAYEGQNLNWDIRAHKHLWQEWLENPPNMTKIGFAYTVRHLQFKKGDYAAMLKEPRMAGPFIKSFETMAQVV